jgi:hypothetical protein
VPGLTQPLRWLPGPPSLSAYRRQFREPVNRKVLGTVVRWCRKVVDLRQDIPPD